MNRRGTILAFILGILVGLALALFGEPWLGPRFRALSGRQETVEGAVAAKQRQPERLLVTVVTPAGATLATFTKRVPEIDLLVQVGDTVTLEISAYQPFLENPHITNVAKPGDHPVEREVAPAPAADSAAAAVDTAG
jgi:hypothetical protein